jgi:CRISPR-associated protein Cas1
MSTLYLDRSDTQLRLDNGSLQIQSSDASQARQRLPVAMIERVVVLANTKLDTSTLAGLTNAGVSLTVLAGRRGDRVAHVLGASHNDARLRIAQVLAAEQPLARLGIARIIVRGKLAAQRRLLRAIQVQRPDLRKPCHDALAALDGLAQRQRNEPAQRLDSLRGEEGAAARNYFPALFAAFPAALEVTTRQRRPPPDPVNATLSLGYTLLVSHAVRILWQVGLDPAIGYLHGLAHGRPALACDLIEPSRPVVDRAVWRLFAERELRGEHFGKDGSGACLLAKAGRARFYDAWAALAPSLDRRLLGHARLLQRHLRQLAPNVGKEDEDEWLAS